MINMGQDTNISDITGLPLQASQLFWSNDRHDCGDSSEKRLVEWKSVYQNAQVSETELPGAMEPGLQIL